MNDPLPPYVVTLKAVPVVVTVRREQRSGEVIGRRAERLYLHYRQRLATGSVASCQIPDIGRMSDYWHHAAGRDVAAASFDAGRKDVAEQVQVCARVRAVRVQCAAG